MPRFSVIVPVHKVQGYLHACLDSVLGQSYRDIEVIAVDDRSPDGCGAILDAYAARDERVRVLHLPENVGLGRARNAGMPHATGDYLFFLDSDDTLTQGALRALADRLDETGDPDVLVFDYARTHWWGGTRRNVLAPLLAEASGGTFTAAERPAILDLLMVVWNKVYRRDFVEREGFTFPPGYYEDTPWTFPVLLSAERVATLDRICVYYRQRRRGSILSTTSRKHFDVHEQYARVFRFVDARPALAHWRPFLHAKMGEHCLDILAKPDRLPPSDKAEFFRRTAEMFRAHRPEGVRVPDELRVLEGSYAGYVLRRGAGRAGRELELFGCPGACGDGGAGLPGQVRAEPVPAAGPRPRRVLGVLAPGRARRPGGRPPRGARDRPAPQGRVGAGRRGAGGRAAAGHRVRAPGLAGLPQGDRTGHLLRQQRQLARGTGQTPRQRAHPHPSGHPAEVHGRRSAGPAGRPARHRRAADAAPGRPLGLQPGRQPALRAGVGAGVPLPLHLGAHRQPPQRRPGRRGPGQRPRGPRAARHPGGRHGGAVRADPPRLPQGRAGGADRLRPVRRGPGRGPHPGGPAAPLAGRRAGARAGPRGAAPAGRARRRDGRTGGGGRAARRRRAGHRLLGPDVRLRRAGPADRDSTPTTGPRTGPAGAPIWTSRRRRRAMSRGPTRSSPGCSTQRPGGTQRRSGRGRRSGSGTASSTTAGPRSGWCGR
ncbi:CDP-glycerol:polyglycerol phosphate glycero-phosphotransferase [Streptomyces griseoflavus Tu4000]|uniref:CDP-glycerol:polyglycerol phosphate glycero-phosphotransferase n=1 Tax=Streptomyces griseoflavus Tu4000 TaxID=467200 RepID=D9XWY9_9ACTN|nr:CDP-glycerol:polyglycerol phosphate glycero-phosphotransferase [Streptomyces griseoflavus Tu4000]